MPSPSVVTFLLPWMSLSPSGCHLLSHSESRILITQDLEWRTSGKCGTVSSREKTSPSFGAWTLGHEEEDRGGRRGHRKGLISGLEPTERRLQESRAVDALDGSSSGEVRGPPWSAGHGPGRGDRDRGRKPPDIYVVPLGLQAGSASG